MIETIVLAIFTLAMLTLAAAAWSLKAVAAEYAPGASPAMAPASRRRPALQQALLHTATTNFSL